MIAMTGFDWLCAGGSLSADLSGLVSDVSGRYVHKTVHDHAHRQTDQVNFCACTCTHMHKTDLPIAPNKRHARYFMDIISSTPMRRDSSAELFYCCRSPQIPLHTEQKESKHVHNSAASCVLWLRDKLCYGTIEIRGFIHQKDGFCTIFDLLSHILSLGFGRTLFSVASTFLVLRRESARMDL
jgi:hypothetical protein